MGSTLVATIVADDEVRWISVGDSPLYLVSAGRLKRLNADHSMAPQIDALVARGVMTADEGAVHPGRHTLREAVMGQPLSLIDQGSQRLPADARLLLCSDGVHSLSDADIVVQSTKPVHSLIAAVLAVGVRHQDNVTIIKLERVP
jgi:serine/threonine protein phosphatase PrpC